LIHSTVEIRVQIWPTVHTVHRKLERLEHVPEAKKENFKPLTNETSTKVHIHLYTKENSSSVRNAAQFMNMTH